MDTLAVLISVPFILVLVTLMFGSGKIRTVPLANRKEPVFIEGTPAVAAPELEMEEAA